MAGASSGSTEAVNAFLIDETVYFKHYFEGDAVFAELRTYYNNQQYRFEVPAGEFDAVATFVEPHGYELTRVESLPEFVVGVEQYTSHPENIFKSSVLQRQQAGYNWFVLKDKVAVEEAVYAGAELAGALEAAHPF